MKHIINKINSYKSYSQQVKDRVLAQVNPTLNISDAKEKEILKRIPAVMKANAEHVRKFNRVQKVVIKLERHTYSPEQNCLYIKGGVKISTPGANSIENAVEQLVTYNYNLVKDRV